MIERLSDDIANRAIHRITHDLRNGLNALQMNSYLLLHSDLSEPARRILEQESRTHRDLSMLVDLAVRVADLQAGKLDVVKGSVGSVDVLRSAATAARKALHTQGVHVDTDAAPPGAEWIEADPDLTRWSLVVLARSGFDPSSNEVHMSIEMRGDDVALCIAGDGLRCVPESWSPDDTPIRGQTIDRTQMELAVVRGIAAAMDARFVRDRETWALVFPRPA